MSSDIVTTAREEYEELMETLEILMDQDLLMRINTSSHEFSQGKGIPLEEVKRRLSED